MDEILQKLLQSELLSEETKAEISQQWTTSVESFKTQVREEVSMEVRSELAEQWQSEMTELTNKVDAFVAEALVREVAELKGDIERFRDLEAEAAEKIVEEKQRLAEEVAKELDALVDKIDAFFEMRLSAELEELKEDLELVRQNEFGRKIFEAFVSEFSTSYVDEDAVQTKLTVAESKLQDVQRALAESEEKMAKVLREQKLEKVLAPLTGKKREQMAMILKNVDTSRLDESYSYFIGRILKEGEEAPAAALTEGKDTSTRVVTGDPVVAPEQKAAPVNESLAHLKRLAGL